MVYSFSLSHLSEGVWEDVYIKDVPIQDTVNFDLGFINDSRCLICS